MLPSAVLLADYAGTVDLSDRFETRARETAGAIKNPGFDLVDTGTVRAHLFDRRWDFTLAYLPTLTLPDLELGWTPQILQSGELSAAWHTRRLRLSLTETATYGFENTAYLPAVQGAVGGAPAAFPTLTAPTNIEFGASRTFLAVDVALTRTVQLRLDGGYLLQGGLDAASQQTMPLLGGPRADARLSVLASRLDTFITDVLAQRSEDGTGPCPALIATANPTETCHVETELAQASESWRHQIARHDWVSLGAGVALAGTRIHETDPLPTYVYPVALASYEHATRIVSDALNLAPELGSARAVLRIDAQVAPYVDLLAGTADYRAQGTVSLAVPVSRTTVRGDVWATQSIDSRFIAPVTMFRADVDVERRVSSVLSLGVGARYAWQKQAPFGTFETGMLYAQATVRAPALEF